MSINKKKRQTVTSQLKQFKNSIESIKSFLKNKDTEEDQCCECGSAACLWSKYDQFNSSTDNEPRSFDNMFEVNKSTSYDVEVSNVVFSPGTYTDTTTVQVGNTKLTGVSKAVLEYDAELGLSVLRLEIIAPQVSPASS
jgi:hypothetical protein